MRLELTDDLTVLIFRDGETVAFFAQPNWPDGSPWESEEQAAVWGQQYLNWLLGVGDEPPLKPSQNV